MSMIKKYDWFSEGRLTDRRCVVSSLILCFFKCSLACSQKFHLRQKLENERKYLNARTRNPHKKHIRTNAHTITTLSSIRMKALHKKHQTYGRGQIFPRARSPTLQKVFYFIMMSAPCTQGVEIHSFKSDGSIRSNLMGCQRTDHGCTK